MTKRHVHLAAHFPGVNNQTVWSDPRAGSTIAFDSFLHMARTAERGLFDFFFLAEGLRLREVRGRIYEHDVLGRPDNISVLSALAGATQRLGLVGTLSATYNEPYDLARKFATLDLVSAGRAGWNVVTTPDAFTGANFRRGGYLAREDRYHRAEDFLSLARTLWESRLDGAEGRFRHASRFFDVEGVFPAPTTPQVHPVVVQAGDSPAGRDFAAGNAEIVFTRHQGPEAGAAFYQDLARRQEAHGRDVDDLKIMPGTTVVIGDTPEEAQEKSRHLARQQWSGPSAVAFLERTWGTDLSGLDPDGPLPTTPPVFDESLSQGRVRHVADPRPTVAAWRALAEERHLSVRELVLHVAGSHDIVGTPAQIAETMDRAVQERTADGFILVPSLTPGGLDEFVDRVVPELQERGAFRTAYTGTTLREHLGLDRPGRGGHRPEAEWARRRAAATAPTTTTG